MICDFHCADARCCDETDVWRAEGPVVSGRASYWTTEAMLVLWVVFIFRILNEKLAMQWDSDCLQNGYSHSQGAGKIE